MSRTVSNNNKYVLFCTVVWDSYLCGRKGDSFLGLRVCSCLTRGNDLFKEIHMLTTQETFLGRDTWAESYRVREAKRAALPCDSVSGFMVMGFMSGLSLEIIMTQGPSW